MRKLFTLCVGMLSMIAPMEAGLKNEMTKFYSSLGDNSNMTSAQLYEWQSAGYATGGGVTIRNRIYNAKFGHITMPSIDAGCGGIDMYLGGFSFINDKQLEEALKSIASSAKGYAFMLGIETISPLIADNIKSMQTWANTLNMQGINSCEVAATAVGSLWPKDSVASQHICRTATSGLGAASDYVSSRHKCNVDNYGDDERQKVADAGIASLLGSSYNLAYEVVKSIDGISDDKELRNFFMSLMGTIIVNESDENHEMIVRDSMINHPNFLNTLYNGGSTKLYQCDTNTGDKCLSLIEVDKSIVQADSWVGMVEKHLFAMHEAVLSNSRLEESQQIFLSRAKPAIYKMVTEFTALHGNRAHIEMRRMAEFIAQDMFMEYLRECVEVARTAAIQKQKEQAYEGTLKTYIESLDKVLLAVTQKEQREMKVAKRYQEMENYLQHLSKQLQERVAID